MPRGGIGQESPKWFRMPLATGHKNKKESQIEESSTLMDYLDRISARAPLTLGFHASKFSLLIDFEN
jgi:hypothetical protein